MRDWSGERAFCDARGLVGLASIGGFHTDYYLDERLRKAARVAFIPQYRRLYCSEVACRLDIALHLRGPDSEFINKYELSDHVLALEVQVRGRKPCALGEASSQVAQQFAASTTRTSEDVRFDLVQPGSPMILIERHADKERPAHSVLAQRASRSDYAEFSAGATWFNAARIPVWSVTFKPHCEANRARQIRGHLWRLHSEREALRNVLRAWRRDPTQFDRVLLRDYLARQLKLLGKSQRYGVEQRPLLRQAQEIEALAPAEVIEDLRAELRRESLGLVRLLDRVMEQTASAVAAAPVRIIVEHGGRLVMHEGDNYTVHGGAYGSAFGPNAQAISGDITVDNAAVEDQLRLLATLLPALLNRVATEDREFVQQAYRQLEQAATPERPDRNRLKSAAARLGQVARSAGEIGAPVAEAINNLLKLFGLA